MECIRFFFCSIFCKVIYLASKKGVDEIISEIRYSWINHFKWEFFGHQCKCCSERFGYARKCCHVRPPHNQLFRRVKIARKINFIKNFLSAYGGAEGRALSSRIGGTASGSHFVAATLKWSNVKKVIKRIYIGWNKLCEKERKPKQQRENGPNVWSTKQ